jgi:formate dehydrogenase subunit gamma
MIEKIREIAQSMAQEPGALLPILQAIQDEFGYVAEAAVPHIASALNLSRAEVHGVISFYHLIRTSPPGNKTLYLCRAESCRAMGGVALEAHAKNRLGIDYHQTTDDGEVSLEPVYCLGNCSCSPSVMIDDRLYSRVSPARLDELLDS